MVVDKIIKNSVFESLLDRNIRNDKLIRSRCCAFFYNKTVLLD
jgi:hypothetical protein